MLQLQLTFLVTLLTAAALVIVPLVRPHLRGACGEAARWGLGLGICALLLGVIGPLLFGAGATGPLMGFLVTGPLGFVVGAAIGFLRHGSKPAVTPGADTSTRPPHDG